MGLTSKIVPFKEPKTRGGFVIMTSLNKMSTDRNSDSQQDFGIRVFRLNGSEVKKLQSSKGMSKKEAFGLARALQHKLSDMLYIDRINQIGESVTVSKWSGVQEKIYLSYLEYHEFVTKLTVDDFSIIDS